MLKKYIELLFCWLCRLVYFFYGQTNTSYLLAVCVGAFEVLLQLVDGVSTSSRYRRWRHL